MSWDNHDATVSRESQYMSAIFYHNEEQKRLAEETKEEHQKTLPITRQIATKIIPAGTFYAAEQ